MPIDYSKYPSNWKTEIRPRILKRAKDCCEVCGIKNKETVFSYLFNGVRVWSNAAPDNVMNIPYKTVKVILTIAHLDHDEENHNVSDDRLKAMCQLCHLQYDSEEKKKRRNLKKFNQ